MVWNILEVHKLKILCLDFKFSPCSLCSMFSFGYFPGVWGLKADVSEPSIGSIFLHLPRKMELIEGSETSAFKPQTPGKYPKENILHKNSLDNKYKRLKA